MVVNRRLLEIYTKVFAPQRGLPQLSESMLIGFQIPIELGRSFVAARTLPGSAESTMQLVGFSERATLAGLSMPLAVVQRINRQYGAEADTYSSVLLRAQSPDDVTEVAAAVKRMGLEIDESERRSALQIGAAVELVTLALSILAALITGDWGFKKLIAGGVIGCVGKAIADPVYKKAVDKLLSRWEA